MQMCVSTGGAAIPRPPDRSTAGCPPFDQPVRQFRRGSRRGIGSAARAATSRRPRAGGAVAAVRCKRTRGVSPVGECVHAQHGARVGASVAERIFFCARARALARRRVATPRRCPEKKSGGCARAGAHARSRPPCGRARARARTTTSAAIRREPFSLNTDRRTSKHTPATRGDPRVGLRTWSFWQICPLYLRETGVACD